MRIIMIFCSIPLTLSLRIGNISYSKFFDSQGSFPFITTVLFVIILKQFQKITLHLFKGYFRPADVKFCAKIKLVAHGIAKKLG